MKRAKYSLVIATVVSLSLSLVLTACSNPEARVDGGAYIAGSVHGYDGPDLADIQAVEVNVDRSSRSAEFTLAGGTRLTAEWTGSRWISGCPTMNGHTRLEVLEIEDATLLIESMEFNNPVLVATCLSGGEFVLRENGGPDTLWPGCGQPDVKCVRFHPTL